MTAHAPATPSLIMQSEFGWRVIHRGLPLIESASGHSSRRRGNAVSNFEDDITFDDCSPDTCEGWTQEGNFTPVRICEAAPSFGKVTWPAVLPLGILCIGRRETATEEYLEVPPSNLDGKTHFEESDRFLLKTPGSPLVCLHRSPECPARTSRDLTGSKLVLVVKEAVLVEVMGAERVVSFFCFV